MPLPDRPRIEQKGMNEPMRCDKSSNRCAALLGALSLAVGLVAAVPEASATKRFDPTGRFCFTDGTGNVNVFVGDRRGFTAYAAGREGNSLVYDRVAPRTYTSDTGGIYTFDESGDEVRWQGGGTVINLIRC